ncbi:hypothetical protein D9M72_562720 [compost metagenome]
MVGPLLQDEVGTRPRRQNVLVQVLQVDVVPEPFGDRTRRILADGRIAVEVGFRILEGGFPEAHEAADVPAVDQALLGVDIDREVEEVRDHRHDLAVGR